MLNRFPILRNSDWYLFYRFCNITPVSKYIEKLWRQILRVFNYCQNTDGAHLKWHLEVGQITFTMRIPKREKKRFCTKLLGINFGEKSYDLPWKLLDKQCIDITSIFIRLIDYIRVHKRTKSPNKRYLKNGARAHDESHTTEKLQAQCCNVELFSNVLLRFRYISWMKYLSGINFVCVRFLSSIQKLFIYLGVYFRLRSLFRAAIYLNAVPSKHLRSIIDKRLVFWLKIMIDGDADEFPNLLKA